jgi:hypothetical protein
MQKNNYKSDKDAIVNIWKKNPDSQILDDLVETIKRLYGQDAYDELFNQIEPFAQELGLPFSIKDNDYTKGKYISQHFKGWKIRRKPAYQKIMPAYLAWMACLHSEQAESFYGRWKLPYREYEGSSPKSEKTLFTYESNGTVGHALVNIKEISKVVSDFVDNTLHISTWQWKIGKWGKTLLLTGVLCILIIISLVSANIWLEQENTEHLRRKLEMAETERGHYRKTQSEENQRLIIAFLGDREGLLKVVEATVERRKKEYPNLSDREIIKLVKKEFEKNEEYRKTIGLIEIDAKTGPRSLARKKFDEGNFEAANTELHTAIDKWTASQEALKNLQSAQIEQSNQTGAKLYAELGSMARTQLDYYSASNYFDEAAKLLEPADALDYQMESAKVLLRQGKSFGDITAIEQSVEKMRKLLKATSDMQQTQLISLMTAISLYDLAQFSGKGTLLEEAESLLQKSATNCTSKEPKEECYRVYVVLREVMLDRGSRPTLTESLWLEHKGRLAYAVEYAKLATYHAQVFEGNKKLEAKMNAQLASYVYAVFINDKILQKTSEDTFYEQYNLFFKNLSQEEHEWSADLYMRFALAPDSFANKTQLRNGITFLKEELARTKKKMPFEWAKGQALLGLSLSRLWKKENNIDLLKEGIAAYERAFSYINKSTPIQFARHQMNYGVLVSDYGREIKDVKTLEKAARIFKISADGFAPDFSQGKGSISDRALAMDNILVVIGRLMDIGSKPCWKEVKQIIDDDVYNSEDYLELGKAYLSKEGAADLDMKSLKKRVNRLNTVMNRLNTAMNITTEVFDECFPAPAA